MSIVPAPYVDPPEPRGPRYGLLTAANGPLPLPPHGEGGGIKYEPVSCGRARRWDADCEPLGSVLAKTFDSADPTIEGEPVTVYATYTCGSAGKTPKTVRDKVLRRLANGEQTEVEEHLGQVLTAAATPVAAPVPTDAASVVGALEQWLYGAGTGQQRYGNVGFLHLPPRFAGQLTTDMVISKVGNVWVTPMGTVVVFGGGYPDDGKVFITGNVTVWRGDVFVPDMVQTFDRESNQWMALAEREYAVGYDCHAAVATFTPA